jgi:hypothetical protein
MNTSQKLRKRYDTFTVVERVNLILAAQERGDEDEVRALQSYCSTAHSIACEARILALALAASAVVVQLLACEVLTVKRLEDLANPREDGESAQAVPANPVRDGLDPSVANDGKLASLLGQAASIWHGFSAWCRGLGYDPHHVLRLAPIGLDDGSPAFFIVYQQIEYAEKWARDVLTDLDQMETWRELFTQAFQSVAGASREQEAS